MDRRRELALFIGAFPNMQMEGTIYRLGDGFSDMQRAGAIYSLIDGSAAELLFIVPHARAGASVFSRYANEPDYL